MPDRSWALQRKLLRAPEIGFNAEVRRWFKDVETTSVNRTKLRDSLLIQANESRTSAMFKIQYFRDFVQKVHDKVNIIGTLQETYESENSVINHPQVTLFFQQDIEAVPNDYYPVTAEISFRLMNETNTTLSEVNIKTLATQIKTELAANDGYTFDKGKYLCRYIDKENGYNLQLYTISDTEGEQVARKIVGIRNHTFVEDNFKVTTPRKNSVNTTSNITILGNSIKKARWRPTARVRFMYANLYIPERPEPLCLVDRTGSKYKPAILAS